MVNYKLFCYSTVRECICGRTCVFTKAIWLHIVLEPSHSIQAFAWLYGDQGCCLASLSSIQYSLVRRILFTRMNHLPARMLKDEQCTKKKKKKKVRSQSTGLIEKRKSGWKMFSVTVETYCFGRPFKTI